MLHYIEKYNKDKTYIFQNGQIANYDRIKNLYPGIDDITYIITTDYTRTIIISIDPLNLKRTELNIDINLNEDQAIEKIIEILDKEDGFTIDDTTRIADALEDLVVLNMPDEEV